MPLLICIQDVMCNMRQAALVKDFQKFMVKIYWKETTTTKIQYMAINQGNA